MLGLAYRTQSCVMNLQDEGGKREMRARFQLGRLKIIRFQSI